MKSVLSKLIMLSAALALAACAPDQNGGGQLKDVSQNGVVNQFFANYGLIGKEGFDAFKAEQTKLLSADLVTVVDYLDVHQEYSGPEGYFASLGDWGKVFATGADFEVRVLPEEGRDTAALLIGTLTMTEGNVVKKLANYDHCWKEFFSLDTDGRIAKLSVEMNLYKTCGEVR